MATDKQELVNELRAAVDVARREAVAIAFSMNLPLEEREQILAVARVKVEKAWTDWMSAYRELNAGEIEARGADDSVVAA